jgi:hypothetical protein
MRPLKRPSYFDKALDKAKARTVWCHYLQEIVAISKLWALIRVIPKSDLVFGFLLGPLFAFPRRVLRYP